MITDRWTGVARGILAGALLAIVALGQGPPGTAEAQQAGKGVAEERPVSPAAKEKSAVAEARPVSAPAKEESAVAEARPEKAMEGVAIARPMPLPAKRKAPEKEETKKGASNGTVTFDFKDADIGNILRIFSLRYGVNIVAGPEVKGKVTIRLVDVPWETALRLVLESNNFTFVREDNVLRVLSRDQIEKEPMKTRVFPLSYATAAEVQGSITHLLTPNRGQIKADARSNTLVVTDVPAKLDQIATIIERLDRRTPQVLIEARVLELTDDFEENIGINWVTLKDYDITVGPPADEGFMTWSREVNRVKDDSTEKKYTDIDLSRSERQSGVGEMGSDTSFGSTEDTGTTTETVISTVPGSSSGTTITTKSPQNVTQNISGNIFEDAFEAEGLDKVSKTTTTNELMQAVLNPDTFQITLNFLQEQNDASLISHPKLVSADNKESVIKVATQWPIPSFQFNDDTGQWEVSGFDYKDIGVVLTVTPHVNEDNFINMDVTPEVSSILGTTTFSGATGAEIPIISTRTAETEVLLRNGDTLAIGGLMREDEKLLVNKVPLFGDIPLLGPYLFSFDRTEIDKNNIIIFVTANLVTEDNKDSFWISQREQQLKRLNLPATKWWEPKKLRYGISGNPNY